GRSAREQPAERRRSVREERGAHHRLAGGAPADPRRAGIAAQVERSPTTELGDPRALAALIAGAILIGFAPIFVRLVDVGYTAAAFWRVALALPVLGVAWLGGAGRSDFAGVRRSEAGVPQSRVKWLWLAGAFFAA